MKNGKYKTFRSKDAYESWRKGMFGRMEHKGKVRFVSREQQAKAKIQYKKKAYKREKDVTDRSNIVSGRVKSHGALVKVEKKKGEERAQGYRTQVTATDNFEVSETEEAGKYTPLNTTLDIQEDGDNIIITRTSKTDGRIISSTILRASSSEGINTFFFDLEERFAEHEDLKLWELRALADHFNIRSGNITLGQLEKRLRQHMEGTLPARYYTNPSRPAEGLPEEEGMTEEERRDQAEFDIPKPSEVVERPFSFEKRQTEVKVPEKPKTDLTTLEQAAAEEALLKQIAEEDTGTIFDIAEEDKFKEEKSPFETLGSGSVFQKPRSKSALSKSTDFIRKPNQSDLERTPMKNIFPTGDTTVFLHDAEGNKYNFRQEPSGAIKLTGVLDMNRDNISGQTDKEDVLQNLNIDDDFEIEYIDTD
jgi:hypothetical protein